jgi:protocatechuate 3,4-dioxygenase beta subunit
MQMQPALLARHPTRNLVCLQDLEEMPNYTLKLEPGVVIRGKLSDPAGKPITNASIQVSFRHGNFGAECGEGAAKADGQFEIHGLPKVDSYNVNAWAEGYGRANRNIQRDESRDRLEVEPVTLQPATLRLAGKVLSQDDKPQAGATVSMSGEDQPSASTVTDANGQFTFNSACPGPVHLWASVPAGNAHANTTAEGGDTNVVIQLGSSGRYISSSAFRLDGVVTKPDGSPAPKIAIQAFPGNWNEVKKSDADGRFNLRLQSGMSESGFIVVARDVERNLAAAASVESGETNVTLKLEKGITVIGHVADPDGRVLTDAEVQIILWNGNTGHWIGQPVKAKPDGTFEVSALPTGQRYQFDAFAKGYGRDSRTVELESGSEKVELDTYQLSVADQAVAGVVVDDNEKPVARAHVNIYGDKQPHANMQTDAKGRFAFTNVCAGTVRLSASGGRGWGNTTVEAGDTNITLTIGRPYYGEERRAPAVTLKGKPCPI